MGILGASMWYKCGMAGALRTNSALLHHARNSQNNPVDTARKARVFMSIITRGHDPKQHPVPTAPSNAF